ncbi:hypothetical protein [Kitasatospora sp. NPDC056184]|uniref:hypothetical protein n=1 Tax=Kitasatospora sp. NPDC056184 TaxID=3345738 RepID=UPI0035DDBB48
MSLTVHVFLVDAGGETRVQDTPEASADLAGFEDWRTRVWGSEAVRSLGAGFFPVLAETDLHVQPEEVPAFLRECRLLRENLGRIVAETQPVRTVEEHGEAISARLAIIEDTAGRALTLGGGVLIW